MSLFNLQNPTCDKCGAPVTTALMAVHCPYRDACEFTPKDAQGREFIKLLRGEEIDVDTLTGAIKPAAKVEGQRHELPDFDAKKWKEKQ